VPGPVSWLHQQHGAAVVVVSTPGDHAGEPADAAVTASPGCALAVRTADCAPVVLVAEGVVGVVHAGWRGLLGGVIEESAKAMVDLGATSIEAVLGPCIRPGCYEFGEAELDLVAARLGPAVRSTTGWGTPALDLAAAVAAACAEAGIQHLLDEAGCTACDRRWFSHRARAEPGRIATIAWLTEPS
jgi:YfiH family protein